MENTMSFNWDAIWAGLLGGAIVELYNYIRRKRKEKKEKEINSDKSVNHD